MMPRQFADRVDAGRQLARLLGRYRYRPNVLVLALPRGGVPVAAEVARLLDAGLDLMVVRKLGLPGHPELGMGAIATGGVEVLDRRLIDAMRVSDEAIEQVRQAEREELRRRERQYRGDRPYPDLTGRTVILVDDGLATGSSMKAAIRAVRTQAAARVVVAVPAAPVSAKREFEDLDARLADEFVNVISPVYFGAVGQWYRDFRQTDDEEVRDLLREAWSRPTEARP